MDEVCRSDLINEGPKAPRLVQPIVAWGA